MGGQTIKTLRIKENTSKSKVRQKQKEEGLL